jgi:hypothetical protein
MSYVNTTSYPSSVRPSIRPSVRVSDFRSVNSYQQLCSFLGSHEICDRGFSQDIVKQVRFS